MIQLKNNEGKYIYLILALFGFIFLKSSYGKVTGGQFVGSLGETLTKFAAKNPNAFVKGFLEQVAIPNATVFGYLTMFGEVFVGLALFGLSIYLLVTRKVGRLMYLILSLGLVVGAFLNTVFYFAAGYTSASTESLNLVMAVVQIIALVFVFHKYSSAEK